MSQTTVDFLRLELIRNGLESIVDEMALTLVRTAYSANLKSSLDFSTAICDVAGRLVAQGLTLPVHLGSIPEAMAAVLARYAGKIRPGDIFILNDPYEGGTHLPDLYLALPVFLEGEVLGYVCCIAHHTDIGGRVAGGNACDSTEIYQEGLRVPPIRLYDRGELNEGFMRLLERNVRIPHKVLGDLRAQLAACHIGEQGLLALVGRYGGEVVVAAFDELLDVSERLARAEIARWPNGRYEFVDYLDDDGIDPDPIPIRVTITVAGDQLEVDFTGSGAQTRGAINSVLSFTRSATYACVRCLLPQNIPNNEGYFRAVRVHAPAGTIVNPLPPGPVAARGLTGFRIATTVFGALAKIVPERVPASEVGGDTGITMGGYYADRQAFVFLEFLFCAWGGRPFADGVDGVSSMVVNFSNYPAEVIEHEYPLRIEEYGFLPDSGGPGLHRGGLALVRQYRFLEREATLQIRSDRTRFAPYGLAGGQPGQHCQTILNPGPGAQVLPAKTLVMIHRGDVFRHELAGAGGWGDPFDRDPDRVLADVLQEKVSVAQAREAYGVVLTADGRAVDETATIALRAERRPTHVPMGPPELSQGSSLCYSRREASRPIGRNFDFMMHVSFITANYVAREGNYNLRPFQWGAADRATVEAFHGPQSSEKFNELCKNVRDAGFSNIDLWVAHLNPFVATKSQVDEAAAVLKANNLRVVAYTGGLGRPDISRAEAEKVYQVANAIGAPVLGVGLNPTNARLAYDLGKEYGVKYAIENHPEKNPQELLARIGDYGEVIGVAQDTGFWGQFGYDALKATRELKDHLFHMHLKQVHQTADGWHSCAYDEGVVDIVGVVGVLKEIGYNGAVSVEHEPAYEDPTPAVVHSAKLLRGWLGDLAD